MKYLTLDICSKQVVKYIIDFFKIIVYPIKEFGEQKMICVCDDCMTFFNAVEGRTDCAYCKSNNIRQATEKEELEYYRNHSSLAVEIQRYVLVDTGYGPKGWYIDLDDKATVSYTLYLNHRYSKRIN